MKAQLVAAVALSQPDFLDVGRSLQASNASWSPEQQSLAKEIRTALKARHEILQLALKESLTEKLEEFIAFLESGNSRYSAQHFAFICSKKKTFERIVGLDRKCRALTIRFASMFAPKKTNAPITLGSELADTKQVLRAVQTSLVLRKAGEPVRSGVLVRLMINLLFRFVGDQSHVLQRALSCGAVQCPAECLADVSVRVSFS